MKMSDFEQMGKWVNEQIPNPALPAKGATLRAIFIQV